MLTAADIQAIAAAVAERIGTPAERLAYSEAEAAALIGLKAHQLRDERLRQRISASSIVGNRIRYCRDDLMAYLDRGRTDAKVRRLA